MGLVLCQYNLVEVPVKKKAGWQNGQPAFFQTRNSQYIFDYFAAGAAGAGAAGAGP